jgi:glucose-1-phosphate thymidylyltransferase
MVPPRSTPLLGLLPMAGRGSRLWPYRYPKELFPVALVPAPDGVGVNPWPVCQYAIDAMRRAGAERCVAVVSDEKYEVLRVLGDGTEAGLPLCYVHQRDALGLPHVVQCARPWLGDADVLLALPDTVVLPGDALARLHEARLRERMDLMLGVLPTPESGRLGPVEIDAEGRVLRILDKPGDDRTGNTWAILSWSSVFTDYCCRWEALRGREGRREGALGHAMEAARADGLRVGAMVFADGMFADIGTPQGLAATVQQLALRGLTFPGAS